MKITPSEARTITEALRYYAKNPNPAMTSFHRDSITDITARFVKAGDGDEVTVEQPQTTDDGPDSWGSRMALDSNADWVNTEWYRNFVVGKASSQSIKGEGLPPGVHLDPFHAQMLTGILGSIGELGELADHIKKYMFHGWQEHPLDMEYIKLEQGDRAWYNSLLDHAFGLKVSTILKDNVAKLKIRYKGRATAHESAHRTEGKPEAIHQPSLTEGTTMSGGGPYLGGAHSPGRDEIRRTDAEHGRCMKFVQRGSSSRQCGLFDGHSSECSAYGAR